MKKRVLFILVLVCMLVITSCSGKDASKEKEQSTGKDDEQENVLDEELNSSLFTDRDFDAQYDEETSAKITLNGNSAVCSSDAVEISGSTVTIKDEGTYILSGSLDEGMIIVNADKEDKTQIVLDNVAIHSEASAPVYVMQADKVFITLAENSENELSNGGSFESDDENNIDGVIFSKEDLTLNGEGMLIITSPAGHGIVSKDELTITGGNYEINSASHGISGKDNVCIAEAEFSITAGKDGIKAENDEDENLGFVYIQSGTFDISAEGDGISAGEEMLIQDGTFDIVTGGGSVNAAVQTSGGWGNFMGGHMPGGGRGSMGGGKTGNPSAGSPNEGMQSMDESVSEESDEDSASIKGLKAAADLTIHNGIFAIDSADDAVHSNSNVAVNGGTYSIATGDDGFHADDTLNVAAGIIDITKSYEGLEGLHVLVSGGTISLIASDDGLNAAGGTDASGTDGMRGGDTFGGRGGMGGMNGSSDGSIVISGGNISIQASGDGLDANGFLEISGGTTIVSGPFSGDTATLDYDTTAEITGGTFIGTGASGMAQTFSGSKQGVIAVNAGNQNQGTKIVLEDKNGDIILEHEAELSFAVVILSSPDVVSGDTYKITVGEISGEFAAS